MTARCRPTWPGSPSRATSSTCAARSAAGSPGRRRRAGQRPLLLLAGGSGVVPLMSMIRAHGAAESEVPVGLIYSVRSPSDVIYQTELSERSLSSPLSVNLPLHQVGPPRRAPRPHQRRRHRPAGLPARRQPPTSSSAAPPASSKRPRPSWSTPATPPPPSKPSASAPPAPSDPPPNPDTATLDTTPATSARTPAPAIADNSKKRSALPVPRPRAATGRSAPGTPPRRRLRCCR